MRYSVVIPAMSGRSLDADGQVVSAAAQRQLLCRRRPMRTPGSSANAVVSSSSVCSERVRLRPAPSITSTTATPSVRTPGSTAYRFATLRASNAAPAAIITASATSAITSPFSRRPPRPSMPPVRARLEDAAQVAAVERDGGHEHDEQGGGDGDRHCRREHAPVRRRGLCPGAERQRARDDGESAPRERRAERAGGGAMSSASTMSCCVSRRRFAPSAERTANSVGPRFDLPQHERRDVRARDQENQRHRAERREQRRSHRADQIVAHRRDVRVLRLVPLRRVIESLVEHRRPVAQPARPSRECRGPARRGRRASSSSSVIPA